MVRSSASPKSRRYAVVPRRHLVWGVVGIVTMALLFVMAATSARGLGGSMRAFIFLGILAPGVIIARRMYVLLGSERLWIHSVFQCVSVALDRIDVDGVRQLPPDAEPYIVEWDRHGLALGAAAGWGRNSEGRRVFSLVNTLRPVLIPTVDDFDLLVSVCNATDFVVQLRAWTRRAQMPAADDQGAPAPG